MTTSQLVRRNLLYYWRTNLAVVLGVATAVAVLAGALLVGDSVRGSLRDLFLQRLGNTTYALAAPGYFRDQLAADIQTDPRFTSDGFTAACPLIGLEGGVTHEASKRLATRVRVYGVDDRFWKFHGQPVGAASGNDVSISESLATDLGAVAGDSLLLRVEKYSEIPVETLHSRKDDLGSTMRVSVRQVLTPAELGEFSIQPQQVGVRAVFVSLPALQKAVALDGRANLILVSQINPSAQSATSLNQILKERATLADFGITIRPVNSGQGVSLEHESKVINDSLAKIASDVSSSLGLRKVEIYSYLANSISLKSQARSIPYSLVTGLDEESFRSIAPAVTFASESKAPPPIVLNDWAARDLGAKIGDEITLEYFLWHEGGRLETRSASFQLVAIAPIKDLAADKELVPEYPGITGSEDLAQWNPPFPVDLKLVRKVDEDYWDQYRTTPKAFLPIKTAQQLWQSRYGGLTSIRLVTSNSDPEISTAVAKNLSSRLDPSALGLAVIPVRAQGLEASQGATNFGEYFLYFSFFLVVSALLLTALFFKLGVEQRLREIGVLQAMGFHAARVRKIFLGEGLLLAIAGSAIGLAGAAIYGELIMFGLRTWWVDAVGTTTLKLHISPLSLLIGGLGGILAAVVCVWFTLRRLGKQSTRSLLSGAITDDESSTVRTKSRRLPLTRLHLALLFSALGVLLLIAAALQAIGQVAGFFGGGTLLLIALLLYQSVWLHRAEAKPIEGNGWWPLTRLGFRNAAARPARSVLCIALIASAAFIIVSVDSFRHPEGVTNLDPKSGTGGFPLLAESLLPIVHDLGTEEGREALNLTISNEFSDVDFERFRVRPGDDASCLNLYQPRNPKIIAPQESFIQGNRFTFADSLAVFDEEQVNPWLLLQKPFADGAVPFIADANSATYVLHLKLGEDLVLPDGATRLRLVGTLANSVLQSELVISEANFLRLFPKEEGYRLFLIETAKPETLATVLEDRLSDFGFDVVATSDRLANFHRVENTYLSTFQMLGGLGLILGTLGMAAVLLRNVLERRRELALLRAVGYNSKHFALMVLAENTLLLVCGLLTGAFCALLAIAPVFLERGGHTPSIALGFLLLAVLISGLIASIVATWATLKSPLLPALRAE